jgi:hypothetical protein
LGLGLSLGATWLVAQWEATRRQIQFQQQIENLSTALQRSLNRYTDVLTFLHDYYRVAAEPVSRQDFAEFVSRSLVSYPGIQALEWAPLVRAGDRAVFEAGVQAEGYPGFTITELSPTGQLQRAGERAEYVPVTYVAPFLTNEAALGYDPPGSLAASWSPSAFAWCRSSATSLAFWWCCRFIPAARLRRISPRGRPSLRAFCWGYFGWPMWLKRHYKTSVSTLTSPSMTKQPG